jgi:hypothetical protein
MAEFQENLGAPGDYQRPVAVKGSGVDIFGAAADMWRKVASADSAAASKAPSAAEVRAEKTAQGLDAFAAGASAIMTDQAEGPGANVLSFFGADAKPLFEEMKRVNEAASDGEISSAVREIQLERLVSGVMGKYPEASYEIMGQALNQIGVDHAYGRAFKLNLKVQQQAETDQMTAQSEAYKVATSAGITGSYDYLVAQGKSIQHSRFLQETAKRAMELRTALADENSKLSAVEKTRLEAEGKLLSKDITNGILQVNSFKFGPIMEELSNYAITAGTDGEMNEQFFEVLKRSKAELQIGRSRAEGMLAQTGASKEDKDQVLKWFDDTNKFVDDLAAGDLSSQKTTLAQVNIIRNTAAIEEAQILPTYQRMVGALGGGMVTAILQGTIIGVSPNELDFLRKDLIEGFATGRITSEAARKKVASFQAALDGTAIPKITNEEDRKEAVNSAAIGLKASLGIFMQDLARTPSAIDLKQFNGASVSLLSAVIEDAPTITLDNLDQVVPLIASAKWRHAAGKALENTADSESAVKLTQYNTVAVASSLNTLKRQYLDTGQVQWNKSLAKYEATSGFNKAGTMNKLIRGKDGDAYLSPEAIKAAGHMNSLLSHLEQVDTNLIEVVPDDKLVSAPDAQGSTTKMSVKEVFATDDGFLQSLINFEQFQQAEEVPKSVKDQFFEATTKFLATNQGGAAFDYSAVAESSAYIQARLNSAEITMGASSGLRVPATDMKSYMINMVQTEGPNHAGGKAHDPSRSTAAGRYGFIDSTWDAYVQRVDPSTKDMSPAMRKALMKDPAIEDAVMQAFTNDNINMLTQRMGRVPSWDEVNIAHMLGGEAPAFIAALVANPLTPAREILDPDTVRANPELTKGTLLDFWNKRLRRKDTDFEDYMETRQGVRAEVPATDLLEGMDDIDALFSTEFNLRNEQ